MLKRNIKTFWINGVIGDDSAIPRLRDMYERILVDEMRTKGYVPVLDLDSQFSLKYNSEKDEYNFNLEMYAVYVGKKKAFEIEGFSGQQFLPR